MKVDEIDTHLYSISATVRMLIGILSLVWTVWRVLVVLRILMKRVAVWRVVHPWSRIAELVVRRRVHGRPHQWLVYGSQAAVRPNGVLPCWFPEEYVHHKDETNRH